MGSFEFGGRENVPGNPGACVTRNFAYLVRGPWRQVRCIIPRTGWCERNLRLFNSLLLIFLNAACLSKSNVCIWNRRPAFIQCKGMTSIRDATIIHSWQKRLLHPGMMCLFCDYFYFISPRGLRTGCLVLYNVFYVFDALFFYSVVFCHFWRHLMIKWVIGRMCIPKCHWKIIVVNVVEQRWFFSWHCLVVSFCVCQVNIGYSRLSRR